MIKKSFYLDQHGCAKNQVDGELIISHLAKDGWSRTEDASSAELIIVNSCGFIEDAKTESINSVLDARASYPNAKILLAGCLAERYHSVLKDEMPEIDGFLGNGDISLVSKAVSEIFNNKKPDIAAPQKGVCCGERIELLGFPGSAYVKITEGCNNRCSFCAIPIIRGELRSRPVSDVVDEIKTLVSKGIVEINLIGQDLASYGKDFSSESDSSSYLSLLLKEIIKLKSNFKIRLLYIHPDNFPLDILPVIKSDTRILPYFDIPFQSGDDEIIQKMNRHGSAKQYVELVRNIKDALPDAVLRTTFLTAFPGETDEQFENTVCFLKEIKPDWSGCFTYSKEDDTPAAELKKKVAKKTALKRKAVLEELQEGISAECLQKHVNKLYEVLIEEPLPSKEGEETGYAIGRAWFQAPDVDGVTVVRYDLTDEKQCSKISAGSVIQCRVTGVNGVDIEGFMVQ